MDDASVKLSMGVGEMNWKVVLRGCPTPLPTSKTLWTSPSTLQIPIHNLSKISLVLHSLIPKNTISSNIPEILKAELWTTLVSTKQNTVFQNRIEATSLDEPLHLRKFRKVIFSQNLKTPRERIVTGAEKNQAKPTASESIKTSRRRTILRELWTMDASS